MTFIHRLLFISLIFVGCGEQGFASEGNKLSVDLPEKEEQYRVYRQENIDNPCDRSLDIYDYEESWFDHSQIYINSKFCEPALWFDSFFANDRLFEEGVAGTYIRWRNAFTYDEEEGFEFKTNLKASIELPRTKHRLRVTFEGDENEDLRDIIPGNEESARNSLGLQFDMLKNSRSKFNVNISLSPKIRFRYRYTYPLKDNLILRFTQELQSKEQINSTRTEFNIEQAFNRNLLLRATSEAKLTDEFDGIDWSQALVLYQRIDKKTSLSYEASANGITEPQALTTNYRVGVRFRKNFLREWLFYEIAPEVTWPTTLNEERTVIESEQRAKWMMFFRLEVHFGNSAKDSYQDFN